MGRVIAFEIPGEPRGKGRPRFTRSGHAFTDPKTREYESTVKQYAALAMRGLAPLAGALSLSIVASHSIPVSYSAKRRAAILAGEEHHFGAFDADNIAKACADSMNGVVYLDDKQIMCLHIYKRAAIVPGVAVEVMELAA